MAVLFGGIASWTLQQHGVEAALSWWLFYLAAVLMILSAVSQTHLLNRALQSLGDTTSIVPVFEVSVLLRASACWSVVMVGLFKAFWISFGVIGGLVFYSPPDELMSQQFHQV